MAVGNSGRDSQLYGHVVPLLKKIRVGGGCLLEWEPSRVLEGMDIMGEGSPGRGYTSMSYCKRVSEVVLPKYILP